MSGCIFCAIANGEVSAELLYDSDQVVAFADIAPQAPVHVLIVPKMHLRNLSDRVPEDVLTSLLMAVPVVARICGVDESGYRVIVNNGPHARQTVEHLHVHVLGGAEFSHGMVDIST